MTDKIEYGSSEYLENRIQYLYTRLDEILDSRAVLSPSAAEFMVIIQLAKKYPAVNSQLDHLMMTIKLIEPEYEQLINQMIAEIIT